MDLLEYNYAGCAKKICKVMRAVIINNYIMLFHFPIILGMFVIMNSDSGSSTYWFNSFSFETAAQYSLIGLIVGLAIYNNVILNINLPMVVYRKLLGKRCTFNDLQDWNEVETSHSVIRKVI